MGAGGALVPYAPAHEFGLNGALGVKAHLRRLNRLLADLFHLFRSILRPILGMFGLENCGSCVIHWISAKIVPKNIDAAIERGIAGG